jgi:SAM-dependent methyltransferase/glycosyltransferase involved in cell wall biosynthesis
LLTADLLSAVFLSPVYCFMHLAYFSPLNPQPSGISDYSEELLPFLGAEADITLFVDGFEPSNQQIRSRFTYHNYGRHPAVLQTLGEYDAIVYHMGNDHRYHTGMLEVARQHPGIIVFHDFALQDFFFGLAQVRGRMEIYLEEIAACHGYDATREAAESIERGRTPPLLARPTDFPLNCRLARSAEGIIVHSEWSRVRFAKNAPAVPVRRIKMPIKPPLESHAFLEAIDTATRVVQIANFGLITPGKGIEQALRALSCLKANHDFHYTLVGEPNSFFDVRGLVREYDMEDRVTITGRVTLEEFEQRIAATDIALNLRERTVGETSASLCRIMAAGVPAIVFDVGAFSELPGDAVVKIEHGEHADALLLAYLRRLIEDQNLRERIGQNARSHILTEHNIEQGAAGYLAFIRDVISRRPRKQFLDSVADEMSLLGVGANDEELLRGIAWEVAVLTPAAELANPSVVNSSSGNSARGTSAQQTVTTCFAKGNGYPTAKSPAGQEVDSPGRLPKIEGIDYKRAALEYPRMLDEERSYYLRTKPFYNLSHKPVKHTGYGMDPETHRHFTDFANMAVTLALPAGARILDVGCGSGWLSEYFARLGYDVSGIDISDELIRMARERVKNIPYNLDHESPVCCRFLVHDIELAPLAENFDGIICYDSLHHLEDERAVFRNLSSMLNVGGLMFILEGQKPTAGSVTENELRDVMRQYGTLESPFSYEYLRTLLDEHGLAVTGDYVSVNGLFERQMLEGNSSAPGDLHLPLRTLPTDYHYLTCMKVIEGAPASSVADSRNPGVLRAEFTMRDSTPRKVSPETKVQIPIRIKNAGDTVWLSGQTVRAGVVMPGIRIMDEVGTTVIELHGHPLLPRAVAPGQAVTLDIQFAAPAEPGTYTVKIDLVDQHICWFEERGSQPLAFSFEVE